jgi:prepilin-type N-terminal cleavage/methylation domain-containing protein
MNRLFNNKGLTLVEVIMTLAILGAVICPLMNLLVISQKINGEGENEYRVIQTAQYYMEETRSMDEIDAEVFVYKSEETCYERTVSNVMDGCSAEIRITPSSYGLHYIEVDIVMDGEVIDSLEGSIILD